MSDVVMSKRKIILSRLANRLAFHISGEKKKILDAYGWYPNLLGGYTHPHAMDYMTRHEIAAMTPGHLEYAMEHGSQAPYNEAQNG